jgi:hypothetical protein
VKIAVRPEAADAEWLTAVLRDAQLLPLGRVTEVRRETIGNGLLGDSIKLTPRYDRPLDNAPRSLVAKFAAADPTSRETGAKFNLYRKELNFYREIAGTVDIRTPRIFFAEFDPDTSDFTLLMEDLSPARVGDELRGCSVQDCALALRELARLHGPRWADPDLEDMAWLQPAERQADDIAAILPDIAADFKKRFAAVLNAEHLSVIDRFVLIYPRVLADRSAPRTLQHGDFRLDNVLFDVQGTAGSTATLDWQTVTLGAGLVDAAFFVGTALSRNARQLRESDLMHAYHDELCRYAIGNFRWEDCWRDYRRFAFFGIFCALFSSAVVKRTARSDALFVQMARHHCEHVLDLDAFSFW